MRTALQSLRDRSLPNHLRPVIAGLVTAALLSLQSVALAADATGDRPPSSYQFVLEVTPKDGAAQRFLFVSAGGRLDASFVSGQVDVDANSIPVISSIKAEITPVEGNKVWMNELSVVQTVPYVTGFTDYGSPNAAPGAPGSRVIPTRRVRSAEQNPAPGDSPGPQEPANQPAPPRPMTRSTVQQANVGITTSVVLTVGKTVTLFEDGRSRVRLTVEKLPE